jgi:hypothetical protein
MKIRWPFPELFLCTQPGGKKKRGKLTKGAPKNVKGTVHSVHRIAKKKTCLQTLTLATSTQTD